MPIPTRARSEAHAGTEAVSKIPSARAHQRTISTAAPQATKAALSTHQRASSLIPKEVKVGQTEPHSSSLLRRPSVRTNTTSNLRQTATATLSAPKPKAAVPVVAPNAYAILRQSTAKPQFNSYQQHFSPKKALRPSSIASDTLSSIENSTNCHETPEVGRLRDELLQLRIIQAGSKETVRQFEHDAKNKLDSKLDSLTMQNESILALEQHRNRCISHTALQKWLEQGDKAQDHKLLQLANCARDLDVLIAENGKYSSLVTEFQEWFEQMILALDSRNQSSENTSETLLFVQPIDPLWLQEAARIQWKLGSLRQSLHDLGPADAGGIQFLLSSYQRLADNLHDELDTCQSIHRTVLEQEGEWVERSLQDLLEGDVSAGQQGGGTYRRGIWRSYAMISV